MSQVTNREVIGSMYAPYKRRSDHTVGIAKTASSKKCLAIGEKVQLVGTKDVQKRATLNASKVTAQSYFVSDTASTFYHVTQVLDQTGVSSSNPGYQGALQATSATSAISGVVGIVGAREAYVTSKKVGYVWGQQEAVLKGVKGTTQLVGGLNIAATATFDCLKYDGFITASKTSFIAMRSLSHASAVAGSVRYVAVLGYCGNNFNRARGVHSHLTILENSSFEVCLDYSSAAAFIQLYENQYQDAENKAKGHTHNAPLVPSEKEVLVSSDYERVSETDMTQAEKLQMLRTIAKLKRGLPLEITKNVAQKIKAVEGLKYLMGEIELTSRERQLLIASVPNDYSDSTLLTEGELERITEQDLDHINGQFLGLFPQKVNKILKEIARAKIAKEMSLTDRTSGDLVGMLRAETVKPEQDRLVNQIKNGVPKALKSAEKIVASAKGSAKSRMIMNSVIIILCVMAVGGIIAADVLSAGTLHTVILGLSLAISAGWFVVDGKSAFASFNAGEAGKYDKGLKWAVNLIAISVSALAIIYTAGTPLLIMGVVSAMIVLIVNFGIWYKNREGGQIPNLPLPTPIDEMWREMAAGTVLIR